MEFMGVPSMSIRGVWKRASCKVQFGWSEVITAIIGAAITGGQMIAQGDTVVLPKLLTATGLIALLAALITYVFRLLYAATIVVPANLFDELQCLKDQQPRLDDVTLHQGPLWSIGIHNQGGAAVFMAYLRLMSADGRTPPETFYLCFNRGAVKEKRLLSGERAEIILGKPSPYSHNSFSLKVTAGKAQYRSRTLYFNDSDDGKSVDVEIVITADPGMVSPVRRHLRISHSGIEMMDDPEKRPAETTTYI